jgi:hypothetical protein
VTDGLNLLVFIVFVALLCFQIYNYDDFKQFGSEAAAQKAGKSRTQGKECVLVSPRSSLLPLRFWLLRVGCFVGLLSPAAVSSCSLWRFCDWPLLLRLCVCILAALVCILAARDSSCL